MRRIVDVLRLKAQGMSNRDIAASVGAGKSAVYEYLARAEGAGISWPLPEDLDDEALEAKLFPPATAAVLASRPVPNWREVHRELRAHKHVTLRLLWLEWRETHPDGLGYSQFCWHYKRWLDRQNVVMRLSYPAGERMFVDFSGDKVPVVDPSTGEVTDAEVFVAVLGCSGMLYVEATVDQSLESWLMANVHAFEAFGGVTVAITPDNLRSGVTRACNYDPEINRSYADFAYHYGSTILPARSYKPRDKAAVEAGVLVVERWVLSPLRKHRFFHIAEMNKAIRHKVSELVERPFRGEPTSRRELFEELERPALKPLPAARYELAHWKKVTVNIDYHVEYSDRSRRHYYSVPYTLVHQKLEVRATIHTVEIYKGNRRVASHAREHGHRRYITDPAHMPPSHRAHLEWTPSRLIEWARSVSPHAAVIAEKILASKPHPEHSYRACLGLMHLAKRYGNERFGAACERALASGAISYTSVKSILQHNLDRVPLPSAAVTPLATEHENLRGAAYYSQDTEEG